jgi:hypothetical protein
MVTVQWTIKNGQTTPAVGRVRWWLPKVLSDDLAIYGRPEPGAWLTLDVDGKGSVEIPDPRSEDVNPRWFTPLVEVETDAWNCAPSPVAFGEDDTSPFELQDVLVTRASNGVPLLRGPRGPQGLPGAPGADGQPGTPGTPGAPGSDGLDGQDGVPGVDGTDGQDGTLKAYAVKNGITGTFGPAGDSGTWTTCPVAYRSEPCPAEVGDVLRWSPAFYHQSDADSVGDLASLDALGAPIRHLSSGVLAPLDVGHGGLYLAAAGTRVLRQLDWVVAAEDIVAGQVTLAFRYRDNGSGNTMGHGTLPGQVAVVNLGAGGGA